MPKYKRIEMPVERNLKVVNRTIEVKLPPGDATFYADENDHIIAKLITPDPNDPETPWKRSVSWYEITP